MPSCAQLPRVLLLLLLLQLHASAKSPRLPRPPSKCCLSCFSVYTLGVFPRCCLVVLSPRVLCVGDRGRIQLEGRAISVSAHRGHFPLRAGAHPFRALCCPLGTRYCTRQHNWPKTIPRCLSPYSGPFIECYRFFRSLSVCG